jgi:hypothetical protein
MYATYKISLNASFGFGFTAIEYALIAALMAVAAIAAMA